MTTTPHYADDAVTLFAGDCIEVMRSLPDASVDAVVTDPPYGLEFMGKEWDRPWAVSAANGVGYEGRDELRLPSHRDSRNANCRACGGRQRGAKRCTCPKPQWDRSPAADMAAFQQWCTEWAAEALRVLKPGGHLAAFGGTRTWHRLACAIEDAGFEIRDALAWMYGSGFPKSLDVSKAIDKAAGAEREVVAEGAPVRRMIPGADQNATGSWIKDNGREFVPTITLPATDAARQWHGWGTALKPAYEPIVLARKPLTGTVAATVLEHGTGALNIDGCRVGTEDSLKGGRYAAHLPDLPDGDAYGNGINRRSSQEFQQPAGRWPANVVLDADAAAMLDAQSDTGGASRFFYTAKADQNERPKVNGVAHPTVKPLDLTRWLVRLVTPPGGVVLEPFAGSGTTAEACVIEGFQCVAIEREPDYLPLIVARLSKPIERTLL